MDKFNKKALDALIEKKLAGLEGRVKTDDIGRCAEADANVDTSDKDDGSLELFPDLNLCSWGIPGCSEPVKKDDYTITGKLNIPCDVRMFALPCKVRIKTDKEDMEAILSEEYCNSNGCIALETPYEFTLVRAGDEVYIKDFDIADEPYTPSIFGQTRIRPIMDIINHKYGSKPRIGLDLEGTVVNVYTKEGTIRFEMMDYRNERYHGILDMNLRPFSRVGKVERGTSYSFSGVMMDNGMFLVVGKSVKHIEDFIKRNHISNTPDTVRTQIELLNEEQLECVKNILEKGTRYESAEKDSKALFNDSVQQKAKYLLCRNMYPPTIQKSIDKCLKTMGVGLTADQFTKKTLSILVNTNWSRETPVHADPEFLKNGLNETHYGLQALKDDLITLVTTNEAKKEKHGAVILINGPAGVGKTSIVRSFSELYGLPFKEISLNGVQNPQYLIGTPRLYSNAYPGMIARTIEEIGIRSVILLDEVDKMTKSDEGDPFTGLYEVLDTSGRFEDQFLETEIDLSDTIFILTSNSTENIPESILNRCEMVNVDGYSDEDKLNIASDYVLPKIMAQYGLTDEDMSISKSALDELANRYNITDGVREIERNIGRVVKAVVKKRRDGVSKRITISSRNLSAFFNLPPCDKNKIEHSIAGMENKFRHFQYNYSLEIRNKIKGLFSEYKTVKDVHERESISKSLFYLINILTSNEWKKYDIGRIKQELDSTHKGLETVKESILMHLAAINATGTPGKKCLLLNGMCGIGKTSICQTLAHAMDRSFIKIPLNGVTSPESIKGFDRTFAKSEAGIVIRKLSENGGTSAFILLDEIDKMSQTANGSNPYTALLDLLDDSKKFTDAYLDIPIDISSVFFVATSNSTENIPVAVLDRMEVIELGGYEKTEKYEILQGYILPRMTAKYHVEQKLAFADEAVKLLSDKYCLSYGMRDAEAAVEKIIKTFLLKKDMKCSMTVTPDIVKGILGAEPLIRGNVSSQRRAGIARAMAVSGNRGITFAIQVTDNPYGKDEITGLPKQSTLDSVNIAKLLVSKYIGKTLPPLHIHFGEGGIEKDGPSAGITIFTAILSFILKKPIDYKTAFTGEVDVYGDVWPIGGVDLKIKAAINEECSKVFIPHGNYIQLADNGDLENYSIEIVPVKSVYEIAEQLFYDKTRLKDTLHR